MVGGYSVTSGTTVAGSPDLSILFFLSMEVSPTSPSVVSSRNLNMTRESPLEIPIFRTQRLKSSLTQTTLPKQCILATRAALKGLDEVF